MIWWIWLHLLQFDVSNQTLSPEEDAVNKADRPLPSKRITLENALRLRWALVPACWAVSALYSTQTLCASVFLVAFTVVYNELAAHSGHWLLRNAVNAAGFASFEAGATLIAGVLAFLSGPQSSGNDERPGSDCSHLDTIALLSICISAGIFATTIQTQDFKDTEGDRAIGRKTIPIVYPKFGRWTVLIPLLAWSVGLSALWRLDALTSTAFTLLAAFIGLRYLNFATVHADQVSFYWYNVSARSRCPSFMHVPYRRMTQVWLSVAHALPGYYRLYAHEG